WFILQEPKSTATPIGPDLLYHPPVFVWVPDTLVPEFQLVCPFCKTKPLGPSGRNSNPVARRVVDLDSYYYILARRLKYRHSCQRSFNPYDEKILDQLPVHLQNEFPAFLTHRSGIDKKLVTLLRSGIAHGLTSHAWEQILRELNVRNRDLAEHLWTMINEKEQIRQMLLTPTDHLHHIERPLQDIVHSLHEHGHEPISFLWTDNVAADRHFAERIIPTLRMGINSDL
ncbi:hypothetical protein B0H13DRAFT_1474352, partial [Mycena leptocephala]